MNVNRGKDIVNKKKSNSPLAKQVDFINIDNQIKKDYF